jgi:hypothetical protein
MEIYEEISLAFLSTHLLVWIIYQGFKGQILIIKKTISHHLWQPFSPRNPEKYKTSFQSHKKCQLPSTEPKIEIHG